MLKSMISAAALAAISLGTASAQTIAVTNGRVVTNSDAGIVESGSVLIQDGFIVAAGANIAIPAGVDTIDANGGWITPGIFHPHTQLGLIEVGLESTTSDVSAPGASFTAAIDVADGFNPSGGHIPDSRRRGITRFAVFPSTARGVIGGRGALANSSGRPDSLFDDRTFLYIDLSQSGAQTAGGSRNAAWAYLRAAFEDARFYPGRFMSHHEGDAINRFDAASLVSAVRGEIPIALQVERASDIRRALRFAQQHPSARFILVGAAESWMVADEIAAAGIPVIIDPLRNLPASFDVLAARLDAPARLHAAGVQTAYTTISADLYFNPRLITQHAGNAVANGASWEDAFRAITLTPAEIHGVGERYGALAEGYAGDVVVWDGDPLEVMSAPVAVIIDGENQSLVSRQSRLAERYAEQVPNGHYGYRH
ncbi:amidohydrolase [Glycocaulis alkaliphilus]|uniref:Amidohydrolase n=1 Tax=Glycocaulis alkaliphilus TaxID=1434191 RepID=A0A3T0EAA3_9PROT|nr:amidohydrolase family protein [Glycocaulis alkaliphilus]AZU04249.1 amidohydrolase [Glycocaulis alkaliphilus]GGB76977.1 amidohydrolase [Glycocaulis alkaliphilus]